MLLQPTQSDEGLARDALWLAAVYAVHNRVRHLRPAPNHETVREMLPQAIKEACQGHATATRAASYYFSPSYLR